MAHKTPALESADSPAIEYLMAELAAGVDANALEFALHCRGDALRVRRIEPDPTDPHATRLAEGELQGTLVESVIKRLRVMLDAADHPDPAVAAGWIRCCIDGRTWRDLFLRHVHDAESDTFVFEDRQTAADLAYRQADYTAAFALLDSMNERQIPAMLELQAHLLERGLGTQQDQTRANELRRAAKIPPSQWCLIGNIVEKRPYGPGGAEVREGTKHFKGRAKVYCLPPQWGDGYEQIAVVGRHRNNNRYTRKIISSAWVTNWRAQVVYSPTVLHRLNRRGLMWRSELDIKRWVARLREREG